MKKLLLLAVIFTPSFAFAQSSGMAWTDGAVLTAQQLQNLDNSKINTSRIGAANGVAPLDANAMMSAAVSGDLSNASITNNNLKVTLPNYLSTGPVNIKDYCGNIEIGQQSGDEACVQNAVNSVGTGQILDFYGNTDWNSGLVPDMTNSSLTFARFNGFVINPPSVEDALSGDAVDNIIPDVTVFNTGSNYATTQPGYERYSSPNKDHSHTPMFQFRQMNDGPSSNQQGSEVVRVSATSTTHSTGNMNGLRTYMHSSGFNYANSYDANTWSQTQSYGTNWIWDHLTEMSNAVPYYCASDSTDAGGLCPEYDMNELDMNMTGPEKPESAYDPSKASRTILGTGGGNSAYKIDNGKHVAWNPSSSYLQYQMIVVKNADGKPYMFYALHTGLSSLSADPSYGFVGSISGSTLTVTSTTHEITIGNLIYSTHINKEVKIIAQLTGTSGDVGTYQVQDMTASTTDMNVSSESMNQRTYGQWSTSGSTAPTWTFNTGDQIVDGTTTWTGAGPFVADTGVVLKYSGGQDIAGGYVSRFGTLMETDSILCYNALIDFSTAAFDPSNAYKVNMRVQPDTYFDFSDKATADTQNLHLLGFNDTDNTLEYLINGKRVFGISSDGTIVTSNAGASFGANSSNAVGINIGSQTSAQPASISLYSGGTNNVSAQIISSNGNLSFNYTDTQFGQAVSVGTSLYLGRMTKVQILALTSLQEGQKVFDTDDHEEVTYRCPTTTTCGWFPVQYGTALSD